jgi:class 3 adenylate cyclase
MSDFIASLNQAREILREQGRLSQRGLGRALQLDSETLDEIIEELVEVQQVAKMEGKVLVWAREEPAVAAPSITPVEQDIASYTPKHLADKILANRFAMEGEKKQVTVLFCDVANSMGLAEALGPEVWHQTLNQFFEVLASAVHTFEGTVNQYTGDGIMALFGAPIAAEDHARRACMAGLAIQENLTALRKQVAAEHGESFAARIGINSGEVVVGKIGDDLRMDYTAQGQVVGVAARLEAKAPPDGTLISEHSKILVDGYFELESIGPQDIKGVSTPLYVYQLGLAKQHITRLDIARERGFSRFVGRDVEMAVLKQAFKRAQSGHGQIVGLTAPPGTGKSRLSWEFKQFCVSQKDVLIVPVSAQQHQRNLPYASNDGIMAVIYGFENNDTAPQKREKVRELHLSWDPQSEKNLPQTYEFVGITDPQNPPPAMSPEAKQRWIVDGVSWIIRQLSKKKTVVYILEDLQWYDPTSMAVLDVWIQQTARGRILMLWNARPEFEPSWPNNLPHMQSLHLHPLDTEALGNMLLATLGDDTSLQGLEERILSASGGNPFYVEEIIRGLVEQGDLQAGPGHYCLTRPVTDLPLPDSIQSLLAARIDRLNEVDKGLLQAVSVLGREFDRQTAQALSDLPDEQIAQSFERLERADFIDLITNDQHQFKHALTQEVAYGSLLQGKRQGLHAMVAAAMEQHGADSDSKLAQLSHHWEHAGELLKAALSIHQAAKVALRRSLNESLRLQREYLRLERAQAAHPDLVKSGLSARRALIQWSLNDVMSSAEAALLYDEACHIATENNNPFALASVWGSYAVRLQSECRLTEACDLADRLLAVVENVPDTMAKAVVYGAVGGVVYGSAGRISQAFLATQRALAILDAHPEFDYNQGFNNRTAAINWHAWALGLGGQAHASFEMFTRLVSEGDIDNDIMIQMANGIAYFITSVGGIADDIEARNARIKRSLNTKAGPFWDSFGHVNLAMGHSLLENWQDAEHAFETALGIARGNEGVVFVTDIANSHLPYVKLRLGKVKEALSLTTKSQMDCLASGSYWLQAMSAWTASRVWREARGADAISDLETLLLEWEKIIDVSGLELYRHVWWWESAKLAQLKGDATSYRAALEKALASADQCEASGHAEKIREELSL